MSKGEPPPSDSRSLRRHGSGWPGAGALLLLAPFFAFFLIFWVVPLLGGIQLSLFSNEPYGPTTFVGLEHYRNLLQDGRYAKALRNTLVYSALSILLIVPFALLLAHLLRASWRRLQAPLGFLLLLPGLTPPAVLALLFLLVFHGREGLLNQLFVVPLSLEPINWIRDPKFILPALVLQSVWRWAGFICFFLLSGMEAIPRALYEAARLVTDSRWHAFRFITLPMLRHVVLFCAVYLLVDAFSLFSGAYVLLGRSGGTDDAGLLLVSYTYQSAFTFGKFGTAAAISVSVAPLLIVALWICFAKGRSSWA